MIFYKSVAQKSMKLGTGVYVKKDKIFGDSFLHIITEFICKQKYM